MPADLIARAHDARILWIQQVVDLREAQEAVEAGADVIIGGLGSVMGSLMGAAFMVLLPEVVQWLADLLAGGAIDRALRLGASISFLREMAIGAAIILFLIFEPDGLARRWRLIKAYWKLYPYSH